MKNVIEIFKENFGEGYTIKKFKSCLNNHEQYIVATQTQVLIHFKVAQPKNEYDYPNIYSVTAIETTFFVNAYYIKRWLNFINELEGYNSKEEI